MKNLKFLLILAYYNRKIMVRNALLSIKDQTYDNWHLYFMDDGSQEKGESVVREILADHLDKVTFEYIPDTPQQKEQQGGSRHGWFMTNAIQTIPADIAFTVCDDDALFPDYLEKLNEWYLNSPEKVYSYSHNSEYNPHTEIYPNLPLRSYGYNYSHDLQPSCTVDSSQVSYRTSCFDGTGIHFPPVGTRNLDASLFSQLHERYGLCSFNGIMGQYKGVFGDQMSHRHNTYNVQDTIL